MNSKSFITAIVFTFLFTTLKAQIIFTPTNDGGKYKLVTPKIPSQDYNGKTPFTRVFLETGNGAFLQFSTDDSLSQLFNKPWYFSENIRRQAVVQLNTFYDTTHRPPHASSFIFNPPVNNNGTNFQDHLYGAQYITITPSIATISPAKATIIPGDTMTLAITYKRIAQPELVPPNDSTIIAFYYNSPGVNNLFSPIDNTTQYNFNGTMVDAIRTHNLETLVNYAEIPSAIAAELDHKKSNFSKALYFKTPYVGNDAERNIFLSLAPNMNPADYNLSRSMTSVRAVVLDYRSSDLTKFDVGYFDQPFMVDFASRDPNYINVLPLSFKDRGSAINRKVDYQVHFENSGPGNANSIVVEVILPPGIRWESNSSNSFTCTIGGRLVRMVTGLVNVPPNTHPRLCYYSFNTATHSIRFEIINTDLKGSIESNGRNDRGDISFSLKTVSAENQNKIVSCMFSKVAIKFDLNLRVEGTFATRVGPGFPACSAEPFHSIDTQ
jgi:uncharacterized repeat protein (TIGR01451 family)